MQFEVRIHASRTSAEIAANEAVFGKATIQGLYVCTRLLGNENHVACTDDFSRDCLQPRPIHTAEQVVREKWVGLPRGEQRVGAELRVTFPNELDVANSASRVASPRRRSVAPWDCCHMPLSISRLRWAEQGDDLQYVRRYEQGRKPADVHFERQCPAHRMALQAREQSCLRQS